MLFLANIFYLFYVEKPGAGVTAQLSLVEDSFNA